MTEITKEPTTARLLHTFQETLRRHHMIYVTKDPVDRRITVCNWRPATPYVVMLDSMSDEEKLAKTQEAMGL